VQTAVLLVLEPIFEADFVDSSYTFRPGRSAHDALSEIRQQLRVGRREVWPDPESCTRGYESAGWVRPVCCWSGGVAGGVAVSNSVAEAAHRAANSAGVTYPSELCGR